MITKWSGANLILCAEWQHPLPTFYAIIFWKPILGILFRKVSPTTKLRKIDCLAAVVKVYSSNNCHLCRLNKLLLHVWQSHKHSSINHFCDILIFLLSIVLLKTHSNMWIWHDTAIVKPRTNCYYSKLINFIIIMIHR